MIQPNIDHLEANIPEELRQARQSLPWKLIYDKEKCPLTPDLKPGDAYDPRNWQTFHQIIDILRAGDAFGIGLALVPDRQTLEQRWEIDVSSYGLITGIVAADGDAKKRPAASAREIPVHLVNYIRALGSYTEFSPSTKGLRSIAFATMGMDGTCITEAFNDSGTQLSLVSRRLGYDYWRRCTVGSPHD